MYAESKFCREFAYAGNLVSCSQLLAAVFDRIL